MGTQSIIIKARVHITRTVYWAQHECFTQIIHLTTMGLGQTGWVICPGSYKDSQWRVD